VCLSFFEPLLQLARLTEAEAIARQAAGAKSGPTSFQGIVMRARGVHWLDYDSIALVAMVVGFGALALLILSM
jgi:hypothetical protein